MTQRTAARKLTPTQARVFEWLAAGFYGQPRHPALPVRVNHYEAACRALVERGLIVRGSVGLAWRLTDAGREHANR